MTALSCVLPVALFIAQAQQPETESRPAVVSGRVVDADSGRPIAGAIVIPAGTASNAPVTPGQVVRMPPRMMTNSSGQFVIRGLKKGSLVLTATKGGYANATHGQRRPGGSAQPIAVNEGDRLAAIEIRMWKHATITGTVIDEAGDPVVGGRVQSFQSVFSGGRRRYAARGSDTTDDRGVYRISGLTPGDYIMAMPQLQGAMPAEVSDALMNGSPNDPKRSELMRETTALGALMIAPAGSPYSMKVGDQNISLPTGTVAPVVAQNNTLMIYPTAFYPAGALPTQAALITVRSGEERSGIDLQVRPSRGLRVSGTIVGPEGPAPHIGLRLSAAAVEDVIDSLETAGTLSDANGAFMFPAVPPGQYVLRVSRVPRPPVVMDDINRTTIVQSGGGVTITSSGGPSGGIVPTPPIPPDPTLCAQVPVTVGDRDVTNVIVALAPGPRVTGRLEFDGTAEKPALAALTNLRIVLEPADGSRLQDFTLASQTGHPNEDGTFTTYGVPPGRYVVRLPIQPGGWTLKSAMYQGRDVSDTPIDLGARDAAGVVITLTDRPASLAGSVRTSNGPDGDAIVVVYPIDSAAWSSSGVTSRRMRTARAGKDGSYTIMGLPAGEYYAVAVKEDMVGEWQDPALLKALASLAQQVRIVDGERKQQDLTSAVIR